MCTTWKISDKLLEWRDLTKGIIPYDESGTKPCSAERISALHTSNKETRPCTLEEETTEYIDVII